MAGLGSSVTLYRMRVRTALPEVRQITNVRTRCETLNQTPTTKTLLEKVHCTQTSKTVSKYQQQRQANAAILGLKTISASPPKNLKRKFLHSVMKYTTNGVSTFNPLILELEIFKAWDVNPNPGPTASNDEKDKKSELHPRIS